MVTDVTDNPTKLRGTEKERMNPFKLGKFTLINLCNSELSSLCYKVVYISTTSKILDNNWKSSVNEYSNLNHILMIADEIVK